MRNLQTLLSSIHESELATTRAVDKTIYKQPELLPERTEALKRELDNLSQYQSRFDPIYEKVRGQISRNASGLIDESITRIKSIYTIIQNSMKKETDEEKETNPKLKTIYFLGI